MSGSHHRRDLTDTQWEHLEPCLPPLNTGVGRKMYERRRHINGMLWILKTSAPWHDLPNDTASGEPFMHASVFGNGMEPGI